MLFSVAAVFERLRKVIWPREQSPRGGWFLRTAEGVARHPARGQRPKGHPWAQMSAPQTRRAPSEDFCGRHDAGFGFSVDEHGAPVTFEPSCWLVCFVPALRAQFWHRFVHKTHKHVFMLKPNPNGAWTLFEPWWKRLLVQTISPAQALKFLRWGAMGDVLLAEEDIPGRNSQLLGWANCASLAAFVLGRPYGAWSPHALFKRLAAEKHTHPIDVGDFADRYLADYPDAPSFRLDPEPVVGRGAIVRLDEARKTRR